MRYVAIDGDDVGRRITSFYLRNDPLGLATFSQLISASMARIAKELEGVGLQVVFAAADGVTAVSKSDDLKSAELFRRVVEIGPESVSLSMGAGNSLREAYVALLAAKCAEKGTFIDYENI